MHAKTKRGKGPGWNKCDDMYICITCTEESEGRTSSGAINRPHPLFDQLKYLTHLDGDIYLKNMDKWLSFLSSSEKYAFAYKVLSVVYQYMSRKTLKHDIESSIKSNENFTLLGLV